MLIMAPRLSLTYLILVFLIGWVFCWGLSELRTAVGIPLTSTAGLLSSSQTAVGMSNPVEKRKLKRSLLREAQKSEFEAEITILALKADDYEQQVKEDDFACTSRDSNKVATLDPRFLPQSSSLSPLAAGGSSEEIVSPCDSSPNLDVTSEASLVQVTGVSPCDSSPNLDVTSEASLVQVTGEPQSSDIHEDSQSDIEEDPSDHEEGYCYYSSGDEELFQGESETKLVVPESTAHEGSGSVPDLKKELVNWAFTHKITHSALNDLLLILRDQGHPLPKLAATLLKTPHCISDKVTILGSGEYWYRGLYNALTLNFETSMSTEDNKIVIDFFIDGISPYDNPSKHVNLWPILGRIVCERKTQPFVIALWCGSKKDPDSIDDFLNPFVDECLTLMKGFDLKGGHYKLVVRNAIGDAPARALEKKVNPHNSKVCCERCEVRCFSERNRMVFPVGCVCKSRTDESFRLKSDAEYHKETPSPLEKIMNMVTQFPLEPLHLVDLGATKRVLKMLVETKASNVYLKPSLREKIDAHIAVLPPYIPSEFKRKPKSLKYWSSLKGKELKRFLKYDGILAMSLLENLMSPLHKGVFECFLNLSLGIRILSDPDLCSSYVEDADVFLNAFVKSGVEVFGPHFNVYNIHHLTHLSDECKLHGTLENFDAYLYESSLGQMERLLHAPGRPLPQIISRVMERENHGFSREIAPREAKFSELGCMGPTDGLRGECYGRYEKEVTFRVGSLNDNCCLTKDRNVVIIENIVKDCEQVYFVGRSFQEKSPFFKSPVDSTLLNIFEVRTLGSVTHWSFSEISRKCFLLPVDLRKEALPEMYDNGCLAIPFTHQSEK